MHRLVSFLMMVSAGAIFVIALVLASVARVAPTELVLGRRRSDRPWLVWLSAGDGRLRRDGAADRLRRAAVLLHSQHRDAVPLRLAGRDRHRPAVARRAVRLLVVRARSGARGTWCTARSRRSWSFCFWIYISAVILLYGVEMTAAYARLRAAASSIAASRRRDPRPLTQRELERRDSRSRTYNDRLMNRLAAEQSPYLLQHADNPVDWYPWGDEAFARARARGQADLPVDRLLDVPLVPRDGARVVRERGDRRRPQPRLRVDQGRSRGAARRRSRLHDVRAGDDRIGRLADERVADAGAAAVLRRHLLPAARRSGAGRAFATCCSRSRAPGGRSAPQVVAVGRRRSPSGSREIAPARGDGGARAMPGDDALAATRAAVQGSVRRAARRLRRRAEVSAAERAAVPAARARAHRRRRGRATWC